MRIVVVTAFVMLTAISGAGVYAWSQEPAASDNAQQEAHKKELEKMLLDRSDPPEKRVEAAKELLLMDPANAIAHEERNVAEAEIKQKQADQQKQDQEKADQQKAKAGADAKETKKNSILKEAQAAFISGNLAVALDRSTAALNLVPGDKSAMDLQNRAQGAIAQQKTRLYALIGFAVALGSAVLVGAFLLLRPGKVMLKVTEGLDTGLEFPIDRKFVRVGASPEHSEIVVGDEEGALSRVHIEVHKSGRRLFIKDVSTNGTRVNGRPIVKGRNVRVKKGDVISLADVTSLEFH